MFVVLYLEVACRRSKAFTSHGAADSQKDDTEERGGVRLRWGSQEFARGRMVDTHGVLILGGNGPVMAASEA